MSITSKNTLFGVSITETEYKSTNKKIRYSFKDSTHNKTFSIDEDSVFRNILLLGSAGSGKTTVLEQILSQTLYWNKKESTDGINIIFDTKGDFYSNKNFRASSDYIIGNDRRFRDLSVTWNIFDEALVDGSSPQDYEPNARELAAMLFKGRGSTSQPFFCDAARDIFAAFIIIFIRKSVSNPEAWKKRLNNYDFVSFLLRHNKNFSKFFNEYDDMKGMESYIGDGTSNQALGVFAELNRMLYDCFQGIFKKSPSPKSPSFSIRKAIRNKGGKNIFILYDLALGESLIPIYRTLVDLAMKEALSEFSNGHTHFFLDELKLLPKISHLEDALNFGRSKRVSVVAGLQSVGQIYSTYEKETGQVILSGFGSIIALKTSDFESRDYITKLFGSNFISYRYQTPNNTPVDREREGKTVEEWDYRSFELPGQAIVGLASQSAPFYFTFDEKII